MRQDVGDEACMGQDSVNRLGCQHQVPFELTYLRNTLYAFPQFSLSVAPGKDCEYVDGITLFVGCREQTPIPDSQVIISVKPPS